MDNLRSLLRPNDRQFVELHVLSFKVCPAIAYAIICHRARTFYGVNTDELIVYNRPNRHQQQTAKAKATQPLHQTSDAPVAPAG